MLTLCMIHNDTHILLGRKKRGFGVGYWNGFGGHVEEGETIEDAARREIQEEAGIIAGALQKHGVLNFIVDSILPETLEVHVFSGRDFEGEPQETDEMEPRWYHRDEIPYHKMWADDCYWLPLLLQGKNFVGKFYFKDINTLINHEITEQ